MTAIEIWKMLCAMLCWLDTMLKYEISVTSSNATTLAIGTLSNRACKMKLDSETWQTLKKEKTVARSRVKCVETELIYWMTS